MKFTGMSPVEIQFVRLYIVTLRREYNLVKTVLHLMSPAGLDIKDFVSATNIANGLNQMQGDFDAAITRISKKHNLRKIEMPPGPTLDELVHLFSLSFFKLVTVVKAPPEANDYDKYQDGWFSGKPDEWKKTLLSLKTVPKNKGTNLPDLLSDFFQAAMKFFPFHQNKWDFDDEHSGKKLWPPQNQQYQQDDYEDDDDDDDQGYPFDWLFEDDYDD